MTMPLGNLKTILSELETNGIFVSPGFFDATTVASLVSEGMRLVDGDPVPFARQVRNGDDCRVATAPCNLDVHNAWNEFSAATGALKRSGVEVVANEFLGRGFGCAHLIYDYSTESDGEELFPLHFDDFDGKRCLKAFIYLTDCNQENGTFRYVPGTHVFGHAHIDAVRKENTGRTYDDPSLASLLTSEEKHFSKITASNVGAEQALERLHSIVKSPKTSYDYCVSGPAGTLVIFDPAGVHGGGELTKGDRLIFRCHYVDPKFVFFHLYDQLSPAKAVISKLLRRLGFSKPLSPSGSYATKES